MGAGCGAFLDIAKQRHREMCIRDRDWGDAAYFGLNAASLLNASGHFVAPSASSIDAALTEATELPNGTLAYDYTTTDPAAYPTPMVTYAAVSYTHLTGLAAAPESSCDHDHPGAAPRGPGARQLSPPAVADAPTGFRPEGCRPRGPVGALLVGARVGDLLPADPAVRCLSLIHI